MVARVTGAYADIYAWDNVYAAYRLAARGKRGRPAAAAFEYRLEDNLIRLQDELAAETYRPGPYASFTIHEPKRRLISAAPFRDRVAHHALCQGRRRRGRWSTASRSWVSWSTLRTGC